MNRVFLSLLILTSACSSTVQEDQASGNHRIDTDASQSNPTDSAATGPDSPGRASDGGAAEAATGTGGRPTATDGTGGGSGEAAGTGGGSGEAAGTGGSDVGPSPKLRVFVTSTAYDGNLGGVTGADAKCQIVADAQDLGGSWAAWISSGGQGALTHVTGSGPWYSVTGSKVFKNRANLSTAPLIDLSDERGEEPEWMDYYNPWTGSTSQGAPSGDDCGGWMSTDGYGTTGSATSDQDWGGGAGLHGCYSEAGLICFEVQP